MSEREVVICSGARTPIGAFRGVLAPLAAPALGAAAVSAARTRAAAAPEQVERVILGNVLSAGLGQAPARQASIAAGLPPSTGAITVNKVCGSGLQAVMFARREILVGDAQVVIAGGMESMSNAPYLLPGARGGYRMGHGELLDSAIHDGLWDPYGQVHMGHCGDAVAERYGFTREEQDAFATESYRRAQTAQREGRFKAEIVPVAVPAKPRGATISCEEDEEPARIQLDKMPRLRPAFSPGGTVTAANASPLSDGAAALLLASEEIAEERGYPRLARVVADATAALEPEWFTIAPIEALRRLYEKTDTGPRDWDLYEINEAFAGVTLAALRDHGLDPARVNVNGGAISLGHPIGCSGARILVTLLYALRERGLRRGVATLCLGGGEAVALAVERR